ncbi:MAG: methyltransferase domain-containing protein [Deltaproteobacteria bacterium]|nr:methyltransferase domain-containing protein [Deltaproteobacteria bacterium]MBW2305684.1 methyltransferase domain-containing protein [Deltaproteobacteria bacterium]
MKIPEKAVRRVFGRRAWQYTTSVSHTDPQGLAKVVKLSSPELNWSALDVATGTGHTAFALAPHVASVTGIDLTPEMLNEAEKLRTERSITNVDFLIADIHHLSFADETFHLITCRRAAHHFSDIFLALREMKRVLRRSGRLVIEDRSGPENDFVDAFMNKLNRYHDESHVRQYRPSHWRRMLEELGFAVAEVEPYIKHRPLASLTDGVSQENVRKIHAMLDRLNDSHREAFNLAEVNGHLHLNHWYVRISAQRKYDFVP